MVETTVRAENLAVPEKAFSYTPLPGFQGRIAVGRAALDKSQPVDITTENVGKDIFITSLVSSASSQERVKLCGTEKPYSAQMDEWRKAFTSSVNEKKEYFTTDPQGIEAATFLRVQLGINVANFTDETAQKVYDEYFGKPGHASDVDAFITNVVGKIRLMEGSWSLDTTLKTTRWLSGMFGNYSADVISQMIHAKIKIDRDPKAFVAETIAPAQPNKLEARSKELLDFLAEASKASPPITIDKRETPPVTTPPVEVVQPPVVEQTKEDNLLCFLANKKTVAEIDMNTLVLEYRKNPIAQIKRLQEKTFATTLQMKKEGKSESEIKEHIRAYLQIQILLDHKAFPPDDVVKRGIPTYIPDGLSDMGSDKETDETKRTGREKIRIDKEKMFENSMNLLYSVFTSEGLASLSLKDRELKITEALSQYVHDKIKYDYQDKLAQIQGGGKSIPASDNEKLNLGVCRHHAIDTQILLQSLGIDSRLMKSNLDALGAHVNNLVHIDNVWYLLDTTNPEYTNDAAHNRVVFMKPLPETAIDLNTGVYTWELDKTWSDGTKKKTKYVSRNNMYFRIRDNKLNPAASHYVLSP